MTFPEIDGGLVTHTELNGEAGNVITVEAGENISAGQAVYINKADGEAYVGDLATRNDIRADGIALTGVSAGSDVSILNRGVYTTSGLTDKAEYYLGVDGALIETPTAIRIGVALSTTELWIDIKQDDAGNVGDVKPVHNTWGSADSGTTDATTANKLEQSGQNFTSTVEPGMIVHNTTDDTVTYVTAVDSNTVLSVADDIFTSGEDYTIYKTRQNSAFWLPCDGSTISDTESPQNGEDVPDMNSTKRFIRGDVTSGTTGGSDTHTHTDTIPQHSNEAGNVVTGGYTGTESITTDAGSTLPAYMEMMWLIKIK